MKRIIWLVRHGERIDNVDHSWKTNGAPPRGHWDDPHLTERGRQQATEVGVRLNEENIDFIFTSPFTRCLETTKCILQKLKKKPPVYVEPGFCESLHATQNQPGFPDLDETKAIHPELATLDMDYKPFFTKETLSKDETSCNCCFVRVSQTLNHVIQSCRGNLLIVSHGSPIAGCHFAFFGEYRYSGQCTISEYEFVEKASDVDETASDESENRNLDQEVRQNINNKENKESGSESSKNHSQDVNPVLQTCSSRRKNDVPTAGIVRIPR